MWFLSCMPSSFHMNWQNSWRQCVFVTILKIASGDLEAWDLLLCLCCSLLQLLSAPWCVSSENNRGLTSSCTGNYRPANYLSGGIGCFKSAKSNLVLKHTSNVFLTLEDLKLPLSSRIRRCAWVRVCLGNINQSSEIPCTIFVSGPMPIFACGSSTEIVHLSTHMSIKLQPLQAILHNCLPGHIWPIKLNSCEISEHWHTKQQQ